MSLIGMPVFSRVLRCIDRSAPNRRSARSGCFCADFARHGKDQSGSGEEQETSLRNQNDEIDKTVSDDQSLDGGKKRGDTAAVAVKKSQTAKKVVFQVKVSAKTYRSE